MILQGKSIQLRALEPTDLEYLYTLENDTRLWEVSNTITPFSKYILTQYLENSHRDIFDVKQLRLIIETKDTKQTIGCIDLFDFDPQHHRVGVGLVVFKDETRTKGYGKESLQLVCNYAMQQLQVHQVYASITIDNQASIALFERVGFIQAGVKKDWHFNNGVYKDELFYQLIKSI